MSSKETIDGHKTLIYENDIQIMQKQDGEFIAFDDKVVEIRAHDSGKVESNTRRGIIEEIFRQRVETFQEAVEKWRGNPELNEKTKKLIRKKIEKIASELLRERQKRAFQQLINHDNVFRSPSEVLGQD